MRRVAIPLSLSVLLLEGCGGHGAPSRAVADALVDVALAAAATAVERRAVARRRARAYVDTVEHPPIETPPQGGGFEPGEPAASSESGARSPLPLYPEGLAVVLAPEDITCDVDADCVVLPAASCCSCAEGGTVVAVRADRLGALRRSRDCVGVTCAPAAPTPSCRAEPTCRHGLCRLLPPEPIPPPPLRPATGPMEVPEGYGPTAP